MEWLLGIAWFVGQGPVAGALVLALFWAALAHPERIRNHNEFRLAALCLGASFLLTAAVPLIVITSLVEGRADRRETFKVGVYFFALPSILTMLSLLFGLDSVTARRAPRSDAPDAVR